MSPLNAERKDAMSGLRPANDLNGATLEDNPLFHQFGDMTSAAAKAAKDYRSWMLDQMKINMGVALDFASGVASVNSRPASVAHLDAPQPTKKYLFARRRQNDTSGRKDRR